MNGTCNCGHSEQVHFDTDGGFRACRVESCPCARYEARPAKMAIENPCLLVVVDRASLDAVRDAQANEAAPFVHESRRLLEALPHDELMWFATTALAGGAAACLAAGRREQPLRLCFDASVELARCVRAIIERAQRGQS